jgi:arylsulfatase A-like enzyme
MDVTPTVLSLAGVPPLPRSGGRDIRSNPARTMVWARTPADVTQVCGPRPGPVLTLRTNSHRVVWGADGIADAYNLRTDPEAKSPTDVPRELVEARAELAGELAPLR